MNKYIPYGRQSIDNEDIKAVTEALKSDFITQGPKIKEFEEVLCRYTGARFAVAVTNGTAALHLACLASGIKTGDEVITPPMTFIASANCVLYCAGTPVFCDIQRDTANIDIEQINKKISGKTKAVIPVHFAGHPCDLEEINKIAKKNGLIVIEDAAHALGAEYKGAKIGSCKFSDMSIFSFHPVKAITTGEGGAILTNNEKLYKKLTVLRNHGIVKEKKDLLSDKNGEWYYEMHKLGYNYRITDLQAALGISQLKKADRFIKRRRVIAKIYDKNFCANPYFDIPKERKYVSSAYHIYPIRLKGNLKNKRKEIFQALRKKGLGVQVHYMPVYLHPYYQKLGYKEGLCVNAEDFYASAISIPLFPSLNDSQIKYVIGTVLNTCGEFN